MDKIDKEKKTKALARWKFLGQMLSQRQCRIDDNVSVRRFSSFGLLESKEIKLDSNRVSNNVVFLYFFKL